MNEQNRRCAVVSIVADFVISTTTAKACRCAPALPRALHASGNLTLAERKPLPNDTGAEQGVACVANSIGAIGTIGTIGDRRTGTINALERRRGATEPDDVQARSEFSMASV